jgi:hypothetical protein
MDGEVVWDAMKNRILVLFLFLGFGICASCVSLPVRETSHPEETRYHKLRVWVSIPGILPKFDDEFNVGKTEGPDTDLGIGAFAGNQDNGESVSCDLSMDNDAEGVTVKASAAWRSLGRRETEDQLLRLKLGQQGTFHVGRFVIDVSWR